MIDKIVSLVWNDVIHLLDSYSPSELIQIKIEIEKRLNVCYRCKKGEHKDKCASDFCTCCGDPLKNGIDRQNKES